VLGVALIAAFVFIEGRHAHPLVPLRLFRSRPLTGANLIMIVIGSAMFSVFFFLSQYLQDVQGYSPLKTGFAFLPLPVAIIVGTQLSARILARTGARALLVIGPLIASGGMLLLSRIKVDSSYPLHIGLAGALMTFGVGMSFVPVTLAATGGVAPRDAGLASGLINTTRQIGGSLGLAALLTVAASRSHAVADQGAKVAETAGFARAFDVATVLLLLAAVIAFVLIPRRAKAPAAVVTFAAEAPSTEGSTAQAPFPARAAADSN
jgi:predicted MFS family arabinose efflux permease